MGLALSTPEPRRERTTRALPPPDAAGATAYRARERRVARRTTAALAWGGAVMCGAIGFALAGGTWTRETLPFAALGAIAIAPLGERLGVRWHAASRPRTWGLTLLVALGAASIVLAACLVSGVRVLPSFVGTAIAGSWLTWTAATAMLSRVGAGWLNRARTHVAVVAPTRAWTGDIRPDEHSSVHFDPSPEDGVAALPEAVMWSHLQRVIRDGAIDRVIFADPDMGRDDLMRAGAWCTAHGVEAHLASPAFDVLRGRTRVPSRAGHPVFVMKPLGSSGLRRLVKRTMDLVGAGLGLVLLSPLFAVLGVLVRRSSPGPVLFQQARVGEGGETFNFLKFRSMRTGSSTDTHEAYIKKLASGGEAASLDKNGQKIFKLVNDPRITPVGHFIRKTSLDELPQLVNVLRGEMSLVGPRPSLAYELDVYKDWHRRRMDATPGCTGLWQVTGRSAVDFDEMMVLDLHYIANATPLDDLRLIALTVPVMALGRGGL